MAKNFTIDGETLELIEGIRDKTGRETQSAVLVDAIRAYSWIVGEYERGWEVISKDPHSLFVNRHPLVLVKKEPDNR